MTKTLNEITLAGDTFITFVDKTNYAINAISTECLTANTDANGSLTVGNTFLNGIFSSNVVAVATLRGGNVQASNVMLITSNVNFTGSQVNVAANINFTSSNTYISGLFTTIANNSFKANSTFDLLKITANSTVLAVTANVYTFTVNGNSAVSANLSVTNQVLSNVVAANTVNANNVTANLVTGNVVSVNTGGRFEYETATTSGTSVQLISTYGIAYKTGKVLINVTNSGANQTQAAELLVLNDGGTTYTTEYAILTSNGVVSTFTANSNATHIRIYATPTVSATNVKVFKQVM
jgi:hypothetical protein